MTTSNPGSRWEQAKRAFASAFAKSPTVTVGVPIGIVLFGIGYALWFPWWYFLTISALYTVGWWLEGRYWDASPPSDIAHDQ